MAEVQLRFSIKGEKNRRYLFDTLDIDEVNEIAKAIRTKRFDKELSFEVCFLPIAAETANDKDWIQYHIGTMTFNEMLKERFGVETASHH